MTKADIVNEISKKTGIDKATVLMTVEAFMESVKNHWRMKRMYIFVDLVALFLRSVHRKPLVTSQRILQSLFPSITYRHLSPLRLSLPLSRSKEN